MAMTETTEGQATRLRRLEQITAQIQRLHNDIAMTHTAKQERKAQLYLNYPPSMSHGERQTRSSHETVDLDNEEFNLRAELDALKVEAEFIRTLIEVW